MDDYKELISTLRTIAGYRDDCHECDYCIQAADAIETLLSEREALHDTDDIIKDTVDKGDDDG